jgi:hypothetical protein
MNGEKPFFSPAPEKGIIKNVGASDDLEITLVIRGAHATRLIWLRP